MPAGRLSAPENAAFHLGSATGLFDETSLVLMVVLAKLAKEDAKLAKKNESVILLFLGALVFLGALGENTKSPQMYPPWRVLEPCRSSIDPMDPAFDLRAERLAERT